MAFGRLPSPTYLRADVPAWAADARRPSPMNLIALVDDLRSLIGSSFIRAPAITPPCTSQNTTHSRQLRWSLVAKHTGRTPQVQNTIHSDTQTNRDGYNKNQRKENKKPRDSRPYCFTAPSEVTWLFYSRCHFLLWSFGTESLNPAVLEILRSKRIGVTSLSFQGHVTSSITWPFDSPYAISYS